MLRWCFSLFTKVCSPVEVAIIQDLLSQDDNFFNISPSVEKCFTSTCLLFQEKFYWKRFGTLMGSPLKLKFTVCLRYADDTSFILPNDKDVLETFSEHLNNQHKEIPLTAENQNSSLPFQVVLAWVIMYTVNKCTLIFICMPILITISHQEFKG